MRTAASTRSLAAASPKAQAPEGRVPAVRSWDDVPVRNKVAWLVVLSAVGGAAAGLFESHMGHRVWPLCAALTVLLALILWLGRIWIGVPFERLVDQMQRIAKGHRPMRLRTLPTTRHDEVGQIARLVQQMTVAAVRDRHEARQLRRTLDHRVARATTRATAQLHQLAMRDPLTGLGNRRLLDENLQPLVQSCLASDHDLACIVIDLDNFKQVNDTLGHTIGDGLLVFLAGLIRGSIRGEDCAVRLGGDEFVALLPGCGPQPAGELGDRLRALFNQHIRTVLPSSLQTDLSVGVATLKESNLTTGSDLLESADARLYSAKRAGKGRVVTQ